MYNSVPLSILRKGTVVKVRWNCVNTQVSWREKVHEEYNCRLTYIIMLRQSTLELLLHWSLLAKIVELLSSFYTDTLSCVRIKEETIQLTLFKFIEGYNRTIR